MKGYKGFDKNMQCRGFQFEVGKEYEEPKAVICESGFHFCENPLDVFAYYSPADSRFCEVEGEGETVKHNNDSKVSCTHIKIGAEVGLPGLINAGVQFILDQVKWDKAKKHNQTEDRSAATNTGNWSAATNTGNRSAASVEGQESVAASLGIEGKAKGALGCWLVLAEWERDKIGNWHRTDVQCKLVDGEIVKADTWYMLRGGQFVEVS